MPGFPDKTQDAQLKVQTNNDYFFGILYPKYFMGHFSS